MIETARLLLRPMHAEDADELLGIFSDPVVMASFGGAPFDGTPVAEPGYDVRSDHWKRGLATEAATAVRRYAFEVSLHACWATNIIPHTSSVNLMLYSGINIT